MVIISQAIFLCVHTDISQHVLPQIWARALPSLPVLQSLHSVHNMVGEGGKLPYFIFLALFTWIGSFSMSTNIIGFVSHTNQLRKMKPVGRDKANGIWYYFSYSGKICLLMFHTLFGDREKSHFSYGKCVCNNFTIFIVSVYFRLVLQKQR